MNMMETGSKRLISYFILSILFILSNYVEAKTGDRINRLNMMKSQFAE